MAPKRAVSAYFLFCNEHREAAKSRYLAASETDKVNVAAIAKLLGEQWRGLTDEERKVYQTRAAEQAAAASEQAAKDAEGNGTQAPDGDDDEAPAMAAEALYPFGFPLSLVKRIVNMDEDVRSISSDALKATAKASEIIVQTLAAGALKVALSNKRKTIKFSDIVQAIAKDKRWEAAGLKELLQHDEMFEEARTGRAVNAKAKEPEVDPKAQQITAFFKA